MRLILLLLYIAFAVTLAYAVKEINWQGIALLVVLGLTNVVSYLDARNRR